MSKILIYHHNDNDGYLAASIADLFYDENRPQDDVEFRVGNYDGFHDVDAIKRADKVYVLDYTLPIGLMDAYFNKIIWIDHHKTAITDMQKIELSRGKPFAGLREVGISGCMLTWRYFHVEAEKVPQVVSLVDDRDVWKWEFGEDTAVFHEASRMFMKDYARWQQLLVDDIYTAGYLSKARPMLEYIRHVIDEYISSYAWEGMFEGHRVVFLNGTGAISGELHKRVREAHPDALFAIVFMVRQDKVTVGMYRRDGVKYPSLGSIATRYGGGGHDGAAGFFTDHDEWTSIVKESNYGSGYRRVPRVSKVQPLG
jgi:oligoribonuclease NrnB/cAMP/cGMP phosphodiesterase (DHH superfamily)